MMQRTQWRGRKNAIFTGRWYYDRGRSEDEDLPQDACAVVERGWPSGFISSACMAFRWVPKSGTDADGKANYYAGNWQGFCGLASKP